MLKSFKKNFKKKPNMKILSLKAIYLVIKFD